MEVPCPERTGRWVGVDRGQNVPAVAVPPDGPVVFFRTGRIKALRQQHVRARRSLQKKGKRKALAARENRESRRVAHINHCLSKQIVALAVRNRAGIRLEDLSGIRTGSRQRRATTSDPGLNRDDWPFYQLERFVAYKALAAGVPVTFVPAAYTSKTCPKCRRFGKRDRHAFSCTFCGYKAHADAVGAFNVRDWEGAFAPLLVSGIRGCCPEILEASPDGPHEPAPNQVHGTPGKIRASA